MSTRQNLLLFFVLSVTIHSKVSACPKDCTCADQRVRCYGHQLQQIPEGVPLDTTHLDLQSNEIETINPDRLRNLTMLQELLLGYNHISAIKPGTFTGLSKLQILNIDSNMLTALSPGVFDGLWNLTSLYLTNNKIVSIDGAFKNLTKLQRMDLGGNMINELTDTTFEDLKSLLYLMLPDNKVKRIGSNTFTPLQSLSYLVLKNNPIKNSNDLFKRNHRLSYIDLTQCSLTDVPTGLPWATRYLQLRSNNITKVKKTAFLGTRYLNIIVLDENQITKIEKGTFGRARELQELWLNDNQLRKIPTPFSSKVTKLHISKNRLSKLSAKDFPVNSALSTLSLNSNMIATVTPGTFSQVKYLKELYLNGNKLTTLKQNLFNGLGKLETLSLNGNKLKSIESGVFKGLVSLTKLNMAFIVDIHTDVQGNIFSDTPFLKHLDLQLSSSIADQVLNSNDMLSSFGNITTINLMNNDLKTLNPNLQTYLSKVEKIKIAGNRWHCDKRLQWLSAWLKSHRKLFFMSRNIQCFTPPSLKGLPVSLLKPFQFAPITSTLAQSSTTSTTTKTTSVNRQKIKPTRKPKMTRRPKVTRKSKLKPKPSPTMQYPPTKQIMVTRTRIVTVTKRFFVYPSTTVSPKQKKSRVTKKMRRKPQTKPWREMHPTTAVKVKDSQVTRIPWKTTMTTGAPFTKQITSGLLTGHSFAVTSETNLATTTKQDIVNESKNASMVHSSKFLNMTADTGSLDPRDTNITETDPEHTQAATVTSTGSVNMTTVIIATCVSAAVLLIILCVIIFFVVRYRQNKLVYHRALQYRQDYSDVVFFVGEPMHDLVDPKQKAVRSRSDRGSTSSRPSEDITNDLDTSMKVYTWDDE